MNKRIMLVEDDVAIVDIYQTILRKNHFDVAVFGSGQEAIKKIQEIAIGKEEKPDMILLDLILPDMNGTEILSAIRKNAMTKSMAVFILTNQENAEKQMPESAKPDKIIIKANTTPTDLVEIIKKAL